MDILRIYPEEQLLIKRYVICDKELNIAKNRKYDGYQRGFASMEHNFFDKKSCVKSKTSRRISQTHY